jgi:hypothetical protein
LTLANDEIYFSRDDHQYFDGQQITTGTIYYSQKVNDEWLMAEQLPEPINIDNSAVEPSISADGQKLYYTGYRPENWPYFFAYVSNKIDNQWSVPEALNDYINQLVWCPWDSSYWGGVPSVTIDSSGTALLFTYWPGAECPHVSISISYLTVGINENKSLPQTIGFNSYPNPFNARTRFEFALPEASPVEICIYDIMGRLAERIDCGYLESGRHSVAWDASRLASGVYFANMAAGSYNSTDRLVLLK